MPSYCSCGSLKSMQQPKCFEIGFWLSEVKQVHFYQEFPLSTVFFSEYEWSLG